VWAERGEKIGTQRVSLPIRHGMPDSVFRRLWFQKQPVDRLIEALKSECRFPGAVAGISNSGRTHNKMLETTIARRHRAKRYLSAKLADIIRCKPGRK